jgi:hypothetical protein
MLGVGSDHFAATEVRTLQGCVEGRVGRRRDNGLIPHKMLVEWLVSRS